jgi:hypothetical protein
MAHKTDISRRDFIKSVAGIVGTLIGVGIGLPSIFYLLSPSLEKTKMIPSSILVRWKIIRLAFQPGLNLPAPGSTDGNGLQPIMACSFCVRVKVK